MNSSLYIGATGMKGLAEGMHVTTNNIANVSTIGFKQQDILFSDILYQTQASMGNWWNAQEDSRVAIGQVGMGLQIEAVRTRFTQGAMESTNTMTDMAINGKGFFQVSDGEKTFYTRAGDFRSDKEGVWRMPSGYALNGYKLGPNGEKGELGAVKVDKLTTMTAKTTSSVNLTLNLNSQENLSHSETNPYFALLQQYDASRGKALDSGSYSTAQTMTVYDAEGNTRTVTAYFDNAPSTNGRKTMEFVIAADQLANVDENGELLDNQPGDGLLMSGILEFDSAGNLVNVAAFTPTEAGSKDLSQWKMAELNNGNPTLNLDGTPMSINFGLSAANGWQNAPESAAEIGTDLSRLPGIGDDAIKSEFPTTAYNTTSMTNSYKQDGYSEGVLSNVSISTDGIVTGYFSNGQNMDLYEIPICRFTSEDGLRREGGNLFSATAESGQMEMGQPGTENYGDLQAYTIENSNVDIAQEMVNMIINQRGFQSNSKVVTTADQMLQKAMELKR